MNELEKLTERHFKLPHLVGYKSLDENRAKESIRFAIEELERQKYSKAEINAAAYPLNRAYINKNKKIDARIDHLKKQIE